MQFETLDDMPVPGLAPAFALEPVFGGTLTLGTVAAGGLRSVRPIHGGTCIGERLSGMIAGGSETRLERADGVTIVEAVYLIDTNWGAIRLTGTGFETAGHLRMSIACEAAADGPDARLAARVFIAERAGNATRIDVAMVT